jgi:hypothetical protein
LLDEETAALTGTLGAEAELVLSVFAIGTWDFLVPLAAGLVFVDMAVNREAKKMGRVGRNRKSVVFVFGKTCRNFVRME